MSEIKCHKQHHQEDVCNACCYILFWVRDAPLVARRDTEIMSTVAPCSWKKEESCSQEHMPRPAASGNKEHLGDIIHLGDMPTYIVGCTPNLSAIIVNCDISGFQIERIRSICDDLSKYGYLVILPDYFRGDYWNNDPEDSLKDLKNEWIRRFYLLSTSILESYKYANVSIFSTEFQIRIKLSMI